MRLSRASYAGLAAAAIGAVTDAVYLVVITSEPEPNDWGRVSLVAGTVGAAVGAAGAGVFLAGGARLVLLTAAATGLLVWGFLGILSIGLPLVVAGLLCAYAAAQAADQAGADGRRGAVLASVAVVALIVFGIAST